MIQHASNNILSRPHYFTLVQQPTNQGPHLIIGRELSTRGPLAWCVAESPQLYDGNRDGHGHGINIPPEHT